MPENSSSLFAASFVRERCCYFLFRRWTIMPPSFPSPYDYGEGGVSFEKRNSTIFSGGLFPTLFCSYKYGVLLENAAYLVRVV